ncbi:glycosyl hydrolase family protein [Mucilaginibacter sp.]|uniref:glycosyl hydrolase family protein n=1 Tax=Mucilaginibacter sp. TaxID=1882438 RepID=UPI003D0BD5B0
MNKLLFTITMVIILSGCRKELSTPYLSPVAGNPANTGSSSPVAVFIDQSQKGINIPSTFQGFSYETGMLAENPDFLNVNNKVLIQLIKNLGPGILRIGGDSSDETIWTGKARTDKTTADSITTTDIDHLAAFAHATGWHVLFGLNLGHYNPAKAANEARYVHNKLKGDLFAFQSGNEPNVFFRKLRPDSYHYPQYQKEWDTYLSTVRKAVPNAPFAGPDITPFDPGWLKAFVKNERGSIKLLDAHFYVKGPASDPLITCDDILSPQNKLKDYLTAFSGIASAHNLPFRISECNSIWGHGKPGVSDVFASSLWALDFMWTVAEYNGQGVNFHGGGSNFIYSPVAGENGVFTPKPEYYAMLAFKYAATNATIIPATFPVQPKENCSVYACENTGNTYSITLINKEVNKDITFAIQLSKSATSVGVARLMAPSITAKTGITFAGSAVDADGNFTAGEPEQYRVVKNTFTVKVPAGSAAVVTVK